MQAGHETRPSLTFLEGERMTGLIEWLDRLSRPPHSAFPCWAALGTGRGGETKRRGGVIDSMMVEGGVMVYLREKWAEMDW